MREIRLTDKYELQVLCDSYILVSIEKEDEQECEVIEIPEIAAYLWQRVSKMDSFTIETLSTLLMQEYDVTEEIAVEDCTLIVDSWLENGIATW